MAPGLLTLPAEIRNIIYELTLTEKTGVNFHLDSRGARRLCLYEKEAGEDNCEGKDDISSKVEQEHSGEVADAHIAGRQEEETSGHGCVRINSLYRLLYVDGDDLQDEPIRHTIANQLQFVCHQLRRETRRLSLRYNKIVFSTPFNDDAMLLCERFLNNFPVHLAQNLTALTIKVNTLPMGQGDGLNTVMQFCHATPTAQVYMHIGQLSKPKRLVELALKYSHVYRRNVPFLAKQKMAAISRLCVQTLKHSVSPAPVNFRLRYGYGNFNEAALRKAMKDDEYMRRQVLPALNGDADGFVEFVREFVGVGF